VPAILGKVVTGVAAPRGPDAGFRIRVRPDWLHVGATIEVTLPRNLECATCHGGGCDACGGSGALTLRGPKDPAETIQLTLPGGPPSSETVGRGLVLRIPESGGKAEADSGLPRGLLLLSVVADDEPDDHVRLCVAGEAPDAQSLAAAIAPRPARIRITPAIVLAILILLWILLLAVI
jgi:hypothetical protein